MHAETVPELEVFYEQHVAERHAKHRCKPEAIYFTIGDARKFVWCQMCNWTKETK